MHSDPEPPANQSATFLVPNTSWLTLPFLFSFFLNKRTAYRRALLYLLHKEPQSIAVSVPSIPPLPRFHTQLALPFLIRKCACQVRRERCSPKELQPNRVGRCFADNCVSCLANSSAAFIPLPSKGNPFPWFQYIDPKSYIYPIASGIRCKRKWELTLPPPQHTCLHTYYATSCHISPSFSVDFLLSSAALSLQGCARRF